MKHRKKRKKHFFHIMLAAVAFLVVAAAVIIFLFQTRSYEVKGNSYYGENTIISWIQNDRLSVNSLYVLIKYNFTDADLPSGVEKMEVSLKNPWTVHIDVTEKEMSGYVDYDDARLYFDSDGNAALRTKRVIEGVPYVEGLVFDDSKVELGKALPVKDKELLKNVTEMSKYLKKYELKPDKVTCSKGDIRIYIGIVEIMLGYGNYEDKLEQVTPIVHKIAELYPNTAGTLHLENFNSNTNSIRYVPSGQ